MRYLGNKSKLLPRIVEAAKSIGFDAGSSGGTVCDLFAGSGVVSRYFRQDGYRVLGCDLMESSHVFQRIYLEMTRPPSFRALREQLDLPEIDAVPRQLPALPGRWQPTLTVLSYLQVSADAGGIDAEDGLFTRQYSTAGDAGRGYFKPEIAGRIDAFVARVRDWSAREWIDDLERDLLTAILINAADRRANISGTYGAYLKKWQSNAHGALEFSLPDIPSGPKGKAHLGDAIEYAPEVRADLLYLDPPYNNRQYAANFHMFEVLVRAIRCDDLAAFEATIYGKTGLVPWKDKASPLCSQRGTECRDAFRSILRSIQVPRVVISYSEEGIISGDEFREMLAEYAGVAESKLGHVLTEIPYRRFRSDADGRVSSTGAGRNYKTLPGRNENEVCEWLFHVHSPRLSS